MLKQLIQKIPGGQNTQVFVATSALLGACAVPVFFKGKKTERGHDLFSQERPEAVLQSQERAMKEFDRKARQDRKQL